MGEVVIIIIMYIVHSIYIMFMCNHYDKRLKQLQQFIKYKTQKNTYQLPPPNTSPKSLEILKQVISSLLKTRDIWNSFVVSKRPIDLLNLHKKDKTLLPEEDKHIYEVLNHQRPDIEEAINVIYNEIQEGMEVSLKFGERTVQVFIMFPKCFREAVLKKLDYHLCKIVMWLNLAFSQASKECSRTMKIYLFLTDLLKGLPTSQKPLGSMNVNTAFTTSCQENTQILLYRYEEWFKVFIHETLHCLGLDFSHQEHAHHEVDKQILEMYRGCDPQLDVRLYETYCEMWAEIVNALFCCIPNIYSHRLKNDMRVYMDIHQKRRTDASFFRIVPKSISQKHKKGGSSNKTKFMLKKKGKTFSKGKSKITKKITRHHLPPQTPQQIMKSFHYYIRREQTFTLFQCSKILDHYGITYLDLCVDNKNEKPKYREDTASLSYYFIKSVFLYEPYSFLEWCAKYNSPFLLFSFSHIQYYIDLLKQKYQSTSYLNSMEHALMDFKKYKKGGNHSEYTKWNKHTLRMSICEA